VSERAERPVNLGWTHVFEASAGFAYYAPLGARLLARLQPGRFELHGMAHLRLLLSDGAGPFYQFGRGDLSERLGAALAKL
jgi:hypothetical protein